MRRFDLLRDVHIERHFLAIVGQRAHDFLHVSEDMLASLLPVGGRRDRMLFAVGVAPDKQPGLVWVERRRGRQTRQSDHESCNQASYSKWQTRSAARHGLVSVRRERSTVAV